MEAATQKMKRIIISRTDAIGDVILTIPLCGIIKQHFPNSKIIFFGRTYTHPVIDLCSQVDIFLNYDEFEKLNAIDQAEFLFAQQADVILHVYPRRTIAQAARRAQIPLRIGTSHRLYHLFSCNKLIHFSRKKSTLHEAQLNIKLLKGVGLKLQPSIAELINNYGLKNPSLPPERFNSTLSTDNFKLILHPKSHGSAREWGLHNYRALIDLLLPYPIKIFITGSEKEKELLKDWTTSLPNNVIDLTGTMNLSELISFINACDGIVAASTGPLHIAAALGKHTIGIYPPIKPMDPTRWAPLGNKATYLCEENACNKCKSQPSQCSCIRNILPALAAKRILSWMKR